ncbi:GATA transcription factor 11-like protein [Trifolium pratense]|uniref:GATA transcription factor 11-like protein n=1 Tax=Trifolium pratense TaxID=57577 RepID=A0A2K3N2Y9_TRIPR|nr:GATA transcription factor 11-like protein [Trifolium pratense]
MPEDIPNMKDSWFFDKNFNGLEDEVFDDVLQFFDFPLEDVETNPAEEDWSALGEPCFDVFPEPPVGLCAKPKIENPQLGNGFSAPNSLGSMLSILFTHSRLYAPKIRTFHGFHNKGRRKCNEISPMIKVPRTAGPAYGKTLPNNGSFFEKKVVLQYSPVSVFEGSSASSGENSSFDLPVIPVKRPRSKRRRPSSSNPVFSLSFIANPSAFQKYLKTPASDSDLNRVKKQRKKDDSVLSGDAETKRSSSQESAIIRKCTHCEVTKTPQWREGPKGPKTLCNACGVRYRSGRLYPEYRPANSPTYVESVHSNCHKKVLEMRGVVVKEGVRGRSMLASSTLSGNSVGQQHSHGSY